MLQITEDLYAYALAASDGEIGGVQDFYFDDLTWAVRYLVADTGSWLTGRQVLLSPRTFGILDHGKKSLQIGLTRRQIEHSPCIDSHLPVSRQHEIDYHRCYGWSGYWAGAAVLGAESFPLIVPPADQEPGKTSRSPEDKHLRSTRAVKGYGIEASDGEIGAVTGFMVDDITWSIRELIVEAGPWYKGEEVLFSPSKVECITEGESKVRVTLAKSDIERTAEHRVVHDCAEKRAPPDFPTD